jgi:hypothetical protein
VGVDVRTKRNNRKENGEKKNKPLTERERENNRLDLAAKALKIQQR